MAERARFVFSKERPKQIGPILVDAFQTEDHTRNSTATTYPVETGAEITDHIRNEPLEIRIQGNIAPVDDGANIFEAFKNLNQIMDDKELVSVITGLKVYENMHMNSLNVSRTARNGGSLPFSANFRQVTKVQSQTVAIAVSQISEADEETNKQAQPATDVGKATSGQTQANGEGESFLDEITAQVNDILGPENWE